MREDIRAARLYLGARLTPHGATEYPGLLELAIAAGDDGSLVAALSPGSFLEEWETGRRGDKVFRKRVPANAAQTLAEGKFKSVRLPSPLPKGNGGRDSVR